MPSRQTAARPSPRPAEASWTSDPPPFRQRIPGWLVRSHGARPSWYLRRAGGWLQHARSCQDRRWWVGRCCFTGLRRAGLRRAGCAVGWSESARLLASQSHVISYGPRSQSPLGDFAVTVATLRLLDAPVTAPAIGRGASVLHLSPGRYCQ